jgi:hypothetical protein
LILVGALGCAATALPPSIAPTEHPCINKFVEKAGLPDLASIEIGAPVRTPAPGPPAQLFRVDYGSSHDCQAGCFNSVARGLAIGCRQIGWIEVNDYEGLPRRRFRMFPGADALLFDPRFWEELERADPGGFWDINDWIRRRMDVPPAVRERANGAYDRRYRH